MSNPYTQPNSVIMAQKTPEKVPWLWTIYSGFILFNLLMTAYYISTGKLRTMLVGIIKADPNYTADAPLEELVMVLFVLNIVIVFVLALIGCFLIWRVNRRNTWALYTLSIYSFLWLALSIYSFSTASSIENFSIATIDYLGFSISSLLLIAVGVRPYFGWRT